MASFYLYDFDNSHCIPKVSAATIVCTKGESDSTCLRSMMEVTGFVSLYKSMFDCFTTVCG